MIFVAPQTVIKGTQTMPSLLLLRPLSYDERMSAFQRTYNEHKDDVLQGISYPGMLQWNMDFHDRSRDAKLQTLLLPIILGTREAENVSYALDCLNREEEERTPASALFGRNSFTFYLDSMKRANEFFSLFYIDKVEGSRFFAQAHVARPNGEVNALPIRPSDACVFALLTHSLLTVDEDVFEEAAIENPDSFREMCKESLQRMFRENMN